jgi:hypothetical protein
MSYEVISLPTSLPFQSSTIFAFAVLTLPPIAGLTISPEKGHAIEQQILDIKPPNITLRICGDLLDFELTYQQ